MNLTYPFNYRQKINSVLSTFKFLLGVAFTNLLTIILKTGGGAYLNKINLKRSLHFINKHPIQNINCKKRLVNTAPGL